MRLKTDNLAVSIYARHGDTCNLEDSYGHHDSLGCASGHKSDDLVLSAKFAYLQEAIDYALECNRRGVCVRLISRIVPNAPFIRNYAPGPANAQTSTELKHSTVAV
jgi:hypothetical protein